ncbi:helix-turn-helix transcriptional regulator [Solidesulfovibrio carbinolicus]|uniref:Uncharacterized protein n=1 Tax=Solidesulfovibrio carbinolicus TaxID=296842 RepID=A0A4P6HL54_9BACT|nr:WYL domain-containing protein [Solidesulfovibrio carbinolicus]QAZ67274.1 hypothetical protein C3Y92_08545 [Solidesulfovibrio carbinolicus]
MPAEESTPSEKTISLFVLLLFTGESYSLTKLSEKFNCSKSTILRRIEAIERWAGECLVRQKIGNEIKFKLNTPKRPLVFLSPDQIRHLIMCRDMVSHLMPESIKDEIGNTINTAASLVEDLSQRAQSFETICRSEVKGRIDYSPFGGVILELESAIRDHSVCLLKYQAVAKDEPREHMFVPVTLSSYRESIYACGVKLNSQRPHDEVGPMVLAVHRIKELARTPLTREVSYPAEMDNYFGIIKHEPIRIKVLFDTFAATYVREREWSTDQCITPQDNGDIVLEFTAANEEEVVSWALSFGKRATVLEPKQVRERIKSELSVMINAY